MCVKVKIVFLFVFSAACVFAQNKGALRLPVATVEEVADFQTKTYPARVVPVAQVNVIPQVSGEILEVGFENGAVVRAGDLLYRLDPVKYEAAVKNAEAKLAESKAAVAYAELSYARHCKLAGTRAVSQDAVDNALSARDTARAIQAAAVADLTVARDNLAHCRITAPISGKLGTTLFTKGNYVTTASGKLVTLIQTSPIRVRFSLSNADYLDMFGGRTHNLRKNGRVRVTLAHGRAFPEKGEMEYVENVADESTDTLEVFALFPNKEHILKPGDTVGITLESATGVKRPSVPHTAVVQDMRGSYVWVLDKDGRAEKRYVVRGSMTQDWQLIVSGLAAGERIVADGVHKVSKGQVVTPAN